MHLHVNCTCTIGVSEPQTFDASKWRRVRITTAQDCHSYRFADKRAERGTVSEVMLLRANSSSIPASVGKLY